MILVDSSVWMDHIARPEQRLVELLDAQNVLMHPFVAGEVLVGSLANRARIRAILLLLPLAKPIPDAVVLANIESWRAYNRGISYVDAHLLSCAVATKSPFWTRDKRLGALAAEHGVRFVEP